MHLWILFVLAIAGVVGTVEVHFEHKDGGFFLKHTPRQYFSTVADLSGSVSGGSSTGSPRGVNSPSTPGIPTSSSSSILSVDKFTVFQNSEPISIRATYGPFSTKQTVPTRYIVPDPIDSLPLPDKFTNNSSTVSSILLDLDLGGNTPHHLDMSAHIVRPEIPRDSPVLRVLFHTGSDAGGRRQLLLSHHQKVCIVLHATMGDRSPLTAACSPDGEDGVCLAQVTIPDNWWAPLPPLDDAGRIGKPVKTPQRFVQVAFSVLEPRTSEDIDGKEEIGCVPRVQIQPVTPLAAIPLVPARSTYRELRTDDLLTMLIPHTPLYPLSRLHIPVFLHPRKDYSVSVIVIRARVKSGLRLLGAEASTDQWNVSVDLNPKHTVAAVTAYRRETGDQQQQEKSESAEEIFSWLVEVVEDSSDQWDGGRIVWSVRYVTEGSETMSFSRGHGHRNGNHHHRPMKDAVPEETRRKLSARLEIQKDDIQAVLPISKNWDVMNTAVLTGRQVSQAMKVFIVSQAGKVADVTLQSSCHSEDESVLKVSSSCSSVYVDGSEIRGSSNASVLVKYGTYTGLAKFTVWMPEFPLEVSVTDFRLSQIKGWKVPDDHISNGKMKRSVNDIHNGHSSSYRGYVLPDTAPSGVEQDRHSCHIRFQQSPVEVYARFLATDHDSGRVSYFVNRRTWLRVTDLVLSLLRVSDPRIASLHGKILQGQGMGRTEVQVLSPITGRVIGAKEVRVGNDKVTITRLQVRVVSGLQLNIFPDTAVENGYVAETSVTRKLTAQYQEGLLDIDIEFSDGSRTPLREVSVSDYHLLVESLDPDVVAFAPMVASHHPRVIAVGEGRGDLLRIALLLAEDCRSIPKRLTNLSNGKMSGKGSSTGPLAAASAYVDVDFSTSDVPQRPEFIQNDGGGNVGGMHSTKERKLNREMPADMHDLHIGIPIKDENNHEPTVQARQHHSAMTNNMGSAAGMRHHFNSMHMTPLEIGMYVLLAAFCFAIVVFVVSCVVYASKFKPQVIEVPIPSGNMQSGIGISANKAAGGSGMSLGMGQNSNSGSSGRKDSRESTTNAHDWVWLGRATLERTPGHGIIPANAVTRSTHIFNNNNNITGKDQQQQMCITTNPMNCSAQDFEDEQVLGTSFDNPTHIELPSRPPTIDTSTYCKKDKSPNQQNFIAHASPVKQPHSKTQQLVPKDMEPDKIWQISPTPPPLPPHGIPLEKQIQSDGQEMIACEDVDYKPPVPPHRNIGVTARIGHSRQHPVPVTGFLPQQQMVENSSRAMAKRHHHHHHHHKSSRGKPVYQHLAEVKPPDVANDSQIRQKNYSFDAPGDMQRLRHHFREEVASAKHQKRQSKEEKYSASKESDGEEEEEGQLKPAFVEFPNVDMLAAGNAHLRGASPQVKQATIVGNPMFSDVGGLNEDLVVREELIGLEDLNLGMDYEQIMEYFNNLKESNA